MPRYETQWTAKDGVRLSAYEWSPASAEPRAVIVLTHGHGEYAHKYEHVGQMFAERGYALQAYDLRGHGRSGGPRGHAPRYAVLLDDLDTAVAAARKRHPGKPVFLYGHSLGGQITLNYAIDRQPEAAGVVLSAPWLQLTYRPPAWKVSLAYALAGVAPSFAQDTGLKDAVPMTHDEALRASYPDPHLAHSWMSARLGVDALAFGEQALARAAELRRPVLILHGGDDGVFKPEVSRAFLERAGASDKTMIEYPGMYHEVHNEVERARVFDDVLNWLGSRG